MSFPRRSCSGAVRSEARPSLDKGRGRTRTWGQFMKAHRDLLCGCDFFTVEALGLTGTVRYMVFFAIVVKTARRRPLESPPFPRTKARGGHCERPPGAATCRSRSPSCRIFGTHRRRPGGTGGYSSSTTIGKRRLPQVPGLASKTPAHTVPHLAQAPPSLSPQATTS